MLSEWLLWTTEVDRAVPCSMLNNVGEAETLLASPDGAADPPYNASGYIFDLAASPLRISSGKIGNMA